MMFRNFDRNRSCVPLSYGLGLGFIPSPPNKIARFRRSTHRNLAISPYKNQQQSHVKMRFYSIFNGGLQTSPIHWKLSHHSSLWVAASAATFRNLKNKGLSPLRLTEWRSLAIDEMASTQSAKHICVSPSAPQPSWF